jgi:hypothetical protein
MVALGDGVKDSGCGNNRVEHLRTARHTRLRILDSKCCGLMARMSRPRLTTIENRTIRPVPLYPT